MRTAFTNGRMREAFIPSPLRGEGEGGGGAKIEVFDHPPFLSFPQKGGRDYDATYRVSVPPNTSSNAPLRAMSSSGIAIRMPSRSSEVTP
jgi:hypothetical protein